MMNLVDIILSEVAGVSSSVTLGKQQHSGSGRKTSANEKAGAGPETSAELELESGLSTAGKKGGRMLVTGMIPSRTAMSNTDRCRSLCFY